MAHWTIWVPDALEPVWAEEYQNHEIVTHGAMVLAMTRVWMRTPKDERIEILKKAQIDIWKSKRSGKLDV